MNKPPLVCRVFGHRMRKYITHVCEPGEITPYRVDVVHWCNRCDLVVTVKG